MSARRVLALVLACALSGCGYALEGRGMFVDPSIRRIGVPLFKDRTGKPGLDQKLTNKVIEELLKRGRFDVVSDATGVDAVVEVELTAYNVVPVGFSAESATTTQASRYAIAVGCRARYRKVGQAEPIWSNDAMSFREEYDVGDDPSTYFDREEQALDRMAANFARALISAMFENF